MDAVEEAEDMVEAVTPEQDPNFPLPAYLPELSFSCTLITDSASLFWAIRLTMNVCTSAASIVNYSPTRVVLFT